MTIVSQVLPPGLHWGNQSGHFSFFSSRCVSVWWLNQHFHECVFPPWSFGASVQVYMSYHAFVKPRVCSKSQASKQLAWKETKRICFKLKQLSRVHSPHTKRKTTPRLNKREVSFTYWSFIQEVQARQQTSTKYKKQINNVIRKEHFYDYDVIVRLMLSSCLNLEQLTKKDTLSFIQWVHLF